MRASLARSLTMEPEVFLFDEPFGALDEITRERLNDELLRLFAEPRFAGLFITHSIAEAVYLSTRVLVMSGAARAASWPTSTCRSPYPRPPSCASTPEFAELCRRGLRPPSVRRTHDCPDGRRPRRAGGRERRAAGRRQAVPGGGAGRRAARGTHRLATVLPPLVVLPC